MHKIRKAVLAVSFAALFILAGTTAHASCPTVTVYYGNPSNTNQFTVDSTCLTTSGSSGVTPVSVAWCYPMYIAGYSYGMGYDNKTTWSFTVPADGNPTGYARKANWSATTQVTFSSPTSSAMDEIHGYVYVTHNGYTTTYNWFYIYGGGSSSQYCDNQTVSFSATAGDTIELIIENTRFDSNAVTEAATPVVLNY
ncbi:MAG TPA: hypothetical protein VGQ21_04105 [Thermoanaerobaculia bacterium]|jgi:hypothetical protein|nr:hypothetical protein [Thermoanaerobaculia bacterium]